MVLSPVQTQAPAVHAELEHVPQLDTARFRPQLSTALAAPQLVFCRAQN